MSATERHVLRWPSRACVEVRMETPFGRLRFLYVGARDMDQDLAYYRSVLGAERVWHFEAFGARVAAVRLGEGPLFLLADHRPAPSCLPIYEVANLGVTLKSLTGRGWSAEGEPFEIPNGPCCLFHDPSGNELAIFQDVRPGAMEGAFDDSENENAVRDSQS